MKKLFAFVIMSVLFSCTNEGDSRATLEAQGYTNVELTGYAWNKCSDDDSTCTGFAADGPVHLDPRTGNLVTTRVHGAVGCSRTGCGKGCTVRITHVGD
jgi:hypothetical protein